MKPDVNQLLAAYHHLRGDLGDAATHWPKMETGGVSIEPEVVSSDTDLLGKLNVAITPTATGASSDWTGWWQTTGAIGVGCNGDWLGKPCDASQTPAKLLDAEWASSDGKNSLQVRHTGGQWRVTRLAQMPASGNTAVGPEMQFDVTTVGRAGYAAKLTHRVYVAWDARRAQMAPYAARLLAIQKSDSAESKKA